MMDSGSQLDASSQGSFALLEGVKVLDLTTSIAGPYATMLLSDLGAAVIKVERSTGDDTRHWGPPFLDGEALWFISVNRNKRSLCLDMTSDAGKSAIQKLLDQADVIITNQLLATQKKLGIDSDTTRRTRPGLIHVSLTGFGLTGPNSARACYDLIAEGYSGVMDLTGLPESAPQKVGTPAADLLAGSDAALAITGALYRRSQTGVGCAIDVTLTESMVRFLAPRIVPFLGSGDVPRRSGGTDSVIAIYQSFETADLPLTLALGNDAIWRRFWQVVERPELAERPGTETNASRRANRAEIVAQIQDILKTQGREQWLSKFAEAKVPAGPINRVDEVVVDPHFLERGLFFEIERDGHSLPQVGLGIRIDGRAATFNTPPPRLGEHTDEILADDLGLSEDEISLLKGDTANR